MEDLYLAGFTLAFWLSCINTLIGIGQMNSIRAKNLQKVGLKYSLWRGNFIEGEADSFTKIFLSTIIGILVACLLSWITVVSIIWGWVKFLLDKSSTPDKIKEIQFKLANSILNKEEVQDSLKEISKIMGKKLVFEEEEEEALVLEESEDGYYTELNLFKDENKIHIYRRTPDYDSEFNTTYKYKIEGQKIYFKLIEDKIEHPGEEYYDVQDGVILKSEIKKRKDNIFFKPESKIKELEGQITWHELNHQYKIIFFLFHKHPELISKDDFRTFLRLKIEKIENISAEVEKIMKDYESLSEKEQEKIVTKLEKFYSENEVSGSEVYNKDELIQEAKKYLENKL
ncbi:hypothetical protein KA071_03125 [Candidatus Gracilibacteria bacterium]|nr:hypothetical protein [Candidatus Gracilibacteria bacterium]